MRLAYAPYGYLFHATKTQYPHLAFSAFSNEAASRTESLLIDGKVLTILEPRVWGYSPVTLSIWSLVFPCHALTLPSPCRSQSLDCGGVWSTLTDARRKNRAWCLCLGDNVLLNAKCTFAWTASRVSREHIKSSLVGLRTLYSSVK